MATVDLTPSGTPTHCGRPWARAPYLISIEVDLADAVTANSDTELVANDVIQVLDIPADSIVLNAGYEVVTAVAGDSGTLVTATIDFGDGGDVDRWVDGANVRTAGNGALASTNKTTLYSTADTLDLLIATANDVTPAASSIATGVIRVWALIVDAS